MMITFLPSASLRSGRHVQNISNWVPRGEKECLSTHMIHPRGVVVRSGHVKAVNKHLVYKDTKTSSFVPNFPVGVISSAKWECRFATAVALTRHPGLVQRPQLRWRRTAGAPLPSG
jgi:hypothetical protein